MPLVQNEKTLLIGRVYMPPLLEDAGQVFLPALDFFQKTKSHQKGGTCIACERPISGSCLEKKIPG
jgi:hypothetical protein